MGFGANWASPSKSIEIELSALGSGYTDSISWTVNLHVNMDDGMPTHSMMCVPQKMTHGIGFCKVDAVGKGSLWELYRLGISIALANRLLDLSAQSINRDFLPAQRGNELRVLRPLTRQY